MSALITSDWLVMNVNDSAALDLVAKVYNACCDVEGLNKLTTLSKEHQASIKESFLKKVFASNTSVNVQFCLLAEQY